jgi:hypothetical protein
MDTPEHSTRTPLKVFIIIAVAAAVTITAALGLVRAMDSLHQRTVRADISEIDDQATPAAPYYIAVRAKISGVDLDNETATVRLECVPTGRDLFGGSGEVRQIKYPITLSLGASRSGVQQTVVFRGAKVGRITYMTLDLDGNVEEYPSDVHTSALWLSAYRAAPGLDLDPLPIRLQAYGAWPGMNITLSAPPQDPNTDYFQPRQLHMTLVRSHATKMVVYFSIVLTWILIVSVIGMTVSVVFSMRPSEVAMLAFFGTLLFAMTAFRNSLPGAPPMGTRSDYLAFFWGYAVAIVAIGVVGADWLRRRGQDERAGR